MKCKKTLLIFSIICIALSFTLISVSYFSNNNYEKAKIITIENIKLVGRLYKGELDQCVIICHGFSSDFSMAAKGLRKKNT